MHYVALVGGKERLVEVSESSPGSYQLTIDGQLHQVDARFVSDSTLSLILEGPAYEVGQAYEVELERQSSGTDSVLVRGEVIAVEVLDLRRMRLRKAQQSSAGREGPETIVSPMPGKIVAVLVAEGDAVREGQGVIVVEAMKMENELKASKDGIVRALNVAEGAAVDGGAVLCCIE